MDEEKNIPVGVKIIAILNYLGAGILVIFALSYFFISDMIGNLLAEISTSAFGQVFFLIAGILLLIFSILLIFIGINLWEGKNWARIIMIIFAGIGIILAMIGIFGGVIGSNIFILLINGLMGGYLLLSRSVKEAFA